MQDLAVDSLNMPDQTPPTQAPDPAENYERAQPQKQSPQGKLSAPKPAGKDRPDDYTKQNESPNEKHK
jgi:hypothetical protein